MTFLQSIEFVGDQAQFEQLLDRYRELMGADTTAKRGLAPRRPRTAGHVRRTGGVRVVRVGDGEQQSPGYAEVGGGGVVDAGGGDLPQLRPRRHVRGLTGGTSRAVTRMRKRPSRSPLRAVPGHAGQRSVTSSSSSCPNVSCVASAAPVPAASSASFEGYFSLMTSSVRPSVSSNVTVVTEPLAPSSSFVQTIREGRRDFDVPTEEVHAVAEVEPVCATGSHVHLAGVQRHSHRLRNPPPLEQLGLRPGLERQTLRRVE